MSLEEVLDKLQTEVDISREELLERIDKKYEELSGLITKEGAAYIIAREFGINLINESRRRLEIKNIVDGLKNLSLIGRIFKISNVVEFKRSDGSDGRVVNLFIGDSTSYIKLPLWNEQLQIVDDENIKLGDVVQISNGLAKENNFGEIEISLGKFGCIKTIEDSLDIPDTDKLINKFLINKIETSSIKNLVPGNFEVKGNIVQVFKSSFLFYNCPICGNTVKNVNGVFSCSEHGNIDANRNLVISCVLDDSTDDIRIVLFRDMAEKMCGIKVSELINMETEKIYEFIKEKILGKEIVVSGRVKKNKFFDRLEMIVNDYKDLNALEESKRLAELIELKFGG